MKNQTLHQLTGSAPDNDAALYHKPISTFDAEEFRLLITQSIAIEYLIPPAIDLLSQDLFAEGNQYEGDLLEAVLSIDQSYWTAHPDQQERLKQAIRKEFASVDQVSTPGTVIQDLKVLVDNFLQLA